MKKHIIAGVPRAGKSTALVSVDLILAGLGQVFPETGIDTEAK